MATEETRKEVAQPVALTEEQQQFLDQCEVDFSGRYTDDDLDFTTVRDNTCKIPPIVDPWYNKPRRNFDWTDRRGRRGGGSGGGDNDRGYQQHRENQGSGGGYQHHRQQNQGGGYQHHRQGDRYYQRHRPY